MPTWVALQLHKYGLLPSFGDNNGIGTVISHNAVSRFYGGTNHTDPYGYFAKWGYSMAEFYELVELKYKEITDEQKDPEIIIEREENLNTDMKIANVDEFFYKNPITKQSNDKIGIIGEQLNINDSVKVLKRITMSDQTESYQLANNWYVKINALKPYATVKNTVAINRPMKVVKITTYTINHITLLDRNDKRLFSVVLKKALLLMLNKNYHFENINVYLLDNGQYVDHRALEEFATVKQTQNINRPMKVIKITTYTINHTTLLDRNDKQLFSVVLKKALLLMLNKKLPLLRTLMSTYLIMVSMWITEH